MKRSIAILLCVLLGPIGVVQAESHSKLSLSDTDASMRSVLLRAMVGGRLKLRLQDDVVLIGVLKTVSDTECTFKVEGEKDPRTFTLVSIESVQHFVKAAESPVVKVSSSVTRSINQALADGLTRRVTLTSYQSYTGRILIGSDDSKLKIALRDETVVEIPRTIIRSIVEPVRSGRSRSKRGRRSQKEKRRSVGDDTRDPNRTRYLFAPSAMMLEKGNGYFSQKELGFSEVAYGVHENVSIVAGGVVPAWFIEPPAGFNLSFGAKFGLEVVDDLYWAAGVYGLVLPGFGNGEFVGGGFVFTTLTGGTENYHGSVSLGVPFLFGADEEIFDPIVVLAGNIRVSDGLALITENWLFPTRLAEEGDGPMINSFALRFISHDFATDVGLVHVLGMGAPIPWLDFTYNWGLAD